ncbi:MAG: bifunctional metallophosphatase/5-nucleotidase [Thermoleophilia bacterium]|nr:bifunctional metallophosphatase/5-nucleotidase [Thermoleophilia bacterium]MCZ4496354.1 bifunctional metallophosphatase/5-nucleotidase [Thermoleophilia bacterium]
MPCEKLVVSLISRITTTLGLTPATPPAPAQPWATPYAGAAADSAVAHVRILSVNDFHGQLPDSTAEVDGVKIGGAATLAAYVARERAGNPDGTFFVSAGDAVGASPPESTLLKHHSSIAALDAMGLDLATFGNHEFDKGYAEAIRLIFGDAAYETALAAQTGVAPAKKRKKGSSAQLDATAGAAHAAAAKGKPAWPGSPFPWVSANVVDKKTKKPILPPYVIREINGVKVAFVGATTKDLKNVTVAKGIQNIEAIDPVVAINKLVPEIQAKGAKAIVVVVHEGGEADAKDPKKLSGPVVELAEKLHPEVDAIISGHSHKEYATSINGKQVVQAGNYAKALAVVELAVDRKTGQVIKSDSRLVRNDEAGIQPDAKVAKMVDQFHAAVAPRTEKVITTLTAPLTRAKAANGETTLGSLIADAQRAWAKTDIGLMNNGGVRQDIEQSGPVKWGTLFGVQPFANRIMKLELTGAEVKETLEQQFTAEGHAKVLQLSGLTVHVDLTKPVGSKVVKIVMADGKPLDPKKTYTVSANSFIADGGDGYTALKKGRKRQDVGEDLEALVKYLSDGKPVPTKVPGRIIVDGGTMPVDGH